MNIDDLVIYDCPLCEGASLLEEEGNSYYVTCMECGCHSVNVNFKTDEDRYKAAQKTIELWNKGKVIKLEPGE
ncbi:Lar family restriction alleviation protein [Floccifex sp.]|uniref:Lar family restriction alleviation protein n=1 Tax=Floccifex sp. TaxID=2815810 RepID=UPI002A75D160|nr:Lar family restriction alleviation protein [Floccifex sp.]MDD7280538.1 Lar family restriction alleviation protein [Erysipelotrichaceae bacterium]MDY2958154.1 Lar family restriction alleviation protein [Floccifex sp.]